MLAQDQHVPARKITFPEGSPLHEGAARQEQVAMELVLSIRNLTPAEQKAKLRCEEDIPMLFVACVCLLVSMHQAYIELCRTRFSLKLKPCNHLACCWTGSLSAAES